MKKNNAKIFEVKIMGMHCASCEVLLERKFKKIEGTTKIDVNYNRGSAIFEYTKNKPDLNQIRNIVKAAGYNLSDEIEDDSNQVSNLTRFIEITGFLIIVSLIFFILNILKVFDNIGVNDNMSLGFIFLIGIVASLSSCLAVTGGLLVSITAKYSKMHPNLNKYQKFKPHIYFNIGRILGYTIFGGLIGAFGSIFTISSKATGILTIFASLIMIILGFDLLGFSPRFLSFLKPKGSKKLSHKIMQKAEKEPSKSTPFILGAATFFLPCGFTIALQLYVLSSGSILLGALTMLAFSLGTMPGLLSLGAFSSFLKGNIKRYFFTIVGIIVIILGIFTIQSGFILAGINTYQNNNNENVTINDLNTVGKNSILDENVRIENGVQIVDMEVKGYSYYPSVFKIKKGIPVEWRIDGTKASGCARVITIPKLGITKSFSSLGITTIKFTPENTGDLEFMCTMAMTTRGARFIVMD